VYNWVRETVCCCHLISIAERWLDAMSFPRQVIQTTLNRMAEVFLAKHTFKSTPLLSLKKPQVILTQSSRHMLSK
jgi:hypothetical protein